MRLARYGMASPIYLGALGPGRIDSGASHGCILGAMDLWISTLHATMWYRPVIHRPPIQDDSRSHKYGVFRTSLPSRAFLPSKTPPSSCSLTRPPLLAYPAPLLALLGSFHLVAAVARQVRPRHRIGQLADNVL